MYSKAKIYPFATYTIICTFMYGIHLCSGKHNLHLAQSFIQCHLITIQSVHYPDNCTNLHEIYIIYIRSIAQPCCSWLSSTHPGVAI